MKESILLFLYSAKNRFSMNALLGALSQSSLWAKSRVVLSNTEKEAEKFIISEDTPIFLCFSSMTTDKERRIRLLQSLPKRSNLFFCGGGPHITAAFQDFTLPNTFLVRGEGEEVFLSLVSSFYTGSLPSLPQASIIDAQRVDFDRYPSFPYKLGFLGPIEISRGCPFGCAFCQTPAIFGRTMRHRSLESIFEHIKAMKKYKECVDVRFITPNALAYGSEDGKRPNTKALTNLLTGIRKILEKKGRIFFGSFPSEVRPEFVSEEILSLLRQTVDNKNIVIGAQSGSTSLLRRMKRRHTLEDVLKASENIVRAGFTVYVDFIFGCPGETEEDLRETEDFMLRITRLGAIIHAHTFLPLPGTPWGKRQSTPLPPWFKKFLGTLAQEGKLFGQWQTQEKLSRDTTLSEGEQI